MYEAACAHVCTRVPMRVEARGFLSLSALFLETRPLAESLQILPGWWPLSSRDPCVSVSSGWDYGCHCA